MYHSLNDDTKALHVGVPVEWKARCALPRDEIKVSLATESDKCKGDPYLKSKGLHEHLIAMVIALWQVSTVRTNTPWFPD